MNTKLKLSLLSAASVLTLAACGNNNQSTETAPQEEQATEQTTDNKTENNTESNTNAESANTENSSDSANNNNTSNAQGLETMDFAVSLQDAFELFKTEVGDDAVQVTDVSFESERGQYIYEFTGHSNGTEYEVDINAETEEIVHSESEPDNLDDDVLNLDNVVEPKEALQAAIDASGSGFVEDWILDVEAGVAAYEVEIEQGTDQTVNAETGEVI